VTLDVTTYREASSGAMPLVPPRLFSPGCSALTRSATRTSVPATARGIPTHCGYHSGVSTVHTCPARLILDRFPIVRSAAVGQSPVSAASPAVIKTARAVEGYCPMLAIAASLLETRSAKSARWLESRRPAYTPAQTSTGMWHFKWLSMHRTLPPYCGLDRTAELFALMLNSKTLSTSCRKKLKL
jgi:hypothetical protein